MLLSAKSIAYGNYALSASDAQLWPPYAGAALTFDPRGAQTSAALPYVLMVVNPDNLLFVNIARAPVYLSYLPLKAATASFLLGDSVVVLSAPNQIAEYSLRDLTAPRLLKQAQVAGYAFDLGGARLAAGASPLSGCVYALVADTKQTLRLVQFQAGVPRVQALRQVLNTLIVLAADSTVRLSVSDAFAAQPVDAFDLVTIVISAPNGTVRYQQAYKFMQQVNVLAQLAAQPPADDPFNASYAFTLRAQAESKARANMHINADS